MELTAREQLARRIVDAVTGDPRLRQLLISDPRAACSQILAVDLPEAVQVTVHEESFTDIHLVIPALPSDQLSDADLELVSGGTGGFCPCCVACSKCNCS